MKRYRLPLLSLITPNEETAKILENSGNKSKFTRDAILSFAEKYGFELPAVKPIYISDDKWIEMTLYQDSHRRFEDESSRIDYSYVVAYYYLKSLPEFSWRQKSEIIREAIKAYALQAEFA